MPFLPAFFLVLWSLLVSLSLITLGLLLILASLVAQLVKNVPALQETWVQSLGWEDPLEKEMANHFSILAWTEKPGGL